MATQKIYGNRDIEATNIERKPILVLKTKNSKTQKCQVQCCQVEYRPNIHLPKTNLRRPFTKICKSMK